jgi:hypothetical protein
MARITVRKLTTANNVPTITGFAAFTRFDDLGNPFEDLEIIINYNAYYLFEGNLGLENTAYPGLYKWKLHIDTPMFPGTYEVEANIYDINTDQTVDTDTSKNELTILPPVYNSKGPTKTKLKQKAATVAALMGALEGLFGNGGVGGPSPSVHPTQDDQSSTSLVARGSKERKEDPRVKSKKQTVDEIPVPPEKHPFKATDPSGDTPLTPDKMEPVKAQEAQDNLASAKMEQGAPIYDQMGNYTGYNETVPDTPPEPASISSAEIEAASSTPEMRAAPDETKALIENNPGDSGVGSVFG